MKTEGYYFLPPGGVFLSKEATLIHTVLGSCVSVCIWDSKNHIGGMNHYIYHHVMSNQRSCRYGDVSIPHLLMLLTRAGGDKKYFNAHIIGGSQSLIPGSIVGFENVKIAKEIINEFQIPINIIDVGEKCFRKVIFHNLSGELIVKKGES